MGIFSKTTDYNLILEQVLEGKRFSANTKSLLLSMLYKIETSYNDYIKVKRISKTKDEFLSYIIRIIRDYFDIVKTVEPESEEAELLKKHRVIAITNEKERTVLSYPTENAMLYAISDIEPKYFYIEEFIFKKQFQQMLVEGSNLNILEILENFNGWSWNSKSRIDKEYVQNIIYQNLIMMFGLEYIETCKNSPTKEYDIIKQIKEYDKEYYKNLLEVIYLKNRSKSLDNLINTRILELKKIVNSSKNFEKLKIKKDSLLKKVEKIDNILMNKELLKKSFLIKNSRLNEEQKISDIKIYIQMLKKDKNEYVKNINKIECLEDSEKVELYEEDIQIYENLLLTKKTLEEAVLDLQKSFIKIFSEKTKQIETRDDFIDIIYKIRYFRNIYLSNEKAIKDYPELEKSINKILRNVITFGTKKAYIRMISYNVSLNSKVLIKCLDSKSMELDELKLKLDVLGKTLVIEVFENEVFEKKFQINYNLSDPELTIRKKKNIRIFM